MFLTNNDNALRLSDYLEKSFEVFIYKYVRYTDIFGKTAELLEIYAGSIKMRKDRSDKMQKLIDGKGADRIASALIDMQDRSLPAMQQKGWIGVKRWEVK